MPITRTRASQLLNQREMALYDESRINGLRKLDARALATRVTRARTARDRARDLVRRQELASRSSTGSKGGPGGTDNQRSKDKAGLMADILSRFEGQLREVKRDDARTAKAAGPKATAGKAAGKKATSKAATGKGTTQATKKATKKVAKTATKPVTNDATQKASKKVARKAAARSPARQSAGSSGAAKGAAPGRSPARAGKQALATRPASKTPASAQGDAGTSASGRSAARAAVRGRTRPADGASARGNARNAARGESSTTRRPRKRKLTPEEALAQTRALLEAKQAREAEPKPWSDTATDGAADGSVGYQSPVAAHRAKRLHAAEMRLPANQGSISTRDRVNQGKRDRRGQSED